MTQIKEKRNYLVLSKANFWMVLVFCAFIFIFCLEPNGKKEDMDENNFRHCYGKFFEIAILKVTWSQLNSKFFPTTYAAQWQWHLINTLQLKVLWTWINIRAKSKFLYWLNNKKKLIVKVLRKLSAAQISKSVIPRRWHFTYHCMLFLLKQTCNY